MEILLWLVPPVVVTLLAMTWVGWLGRERPELDRDVAVRRLGEALERDARRTSTRREAAVLATDRRAGRQPDRSTGIALRRRAS